MLWRRPTVCWQWIKVINGRVSWSFDSRLGGGGLSSALTWRLTQRRKHSRLITLQSGRRKGHFEWGKKWRGKTRLWCLSSRCLTSRTTPPVQTHTSRSSRLPSHCAQTRTFHWDSFEWTNPPASRTVQVDLPGASHLGALSSLRLHSPLWPRLLVWTSAALTIAMVISSQHLEHGFFLYSWIKGWNDQRVSNCWVTWVN